ncbi:MAG: plastocyanin/azurin family copper-binding protein [Planctomycetota bacterium]
MKWLLGIVVVLGLCSFARGQTTHDVIVGPMKFLIFSPADIVIEVGDTVLWTWDSLLIVHNVVSGDLGIPDGHFESGLPVTAPFTFQITFDQAFLDANPKPGNFYPYHCFPHVPFDMFGSIQVVGPELQFTRGDCNGDGMTNIADGIFILNQLFGQPPPIRTCDDACDTNGDRMKNIADAVYIFNFLFVSGSPPPPSPWPDCGNDDNPGALGCPEFAPCP